MRNWILFRRNRVKVTFVFTIKELFYSFFLCLGMQPSPKERERKKGPAKNQVVELDEEVEETVTLPEDRSGGIFFFFMFNIYFYFTIF